MNRQMGNAAVREASPTERTGHRASYTSELSWPSEAPPSTLAKSGIFGRSSKTANAVRERTTHAEFGERKLSLLCEGLGLSYQRKAAIELFRLLTAGWSR